ncbi:NAC domain-containing protein 83-like [Pistacia vera]|uniref:NAC domain-containing protein 83-like n=1 Tax=Pistacia vera TaxID=55513 RepID=UPI001263C6D0|nr:NAC domain-containing protein 83-like [Pistacia vera]
MIVPTGFRFNPTDEELIEILQRKVSGKETPLHHYFIVERNVYEHKPEDLEWDHTVPVQNNERFYYCMKENDSREVSGRGWWKATSHVKKIYANNNKRVVGYKRPLTFHKFSDNERKRNKAIKTNWIMYEYSLESCTTEWRLCKIKYKGKQSGQVIEDQIENMKKNYRLSNESEASCSIMDIVYEEQEKPKLVHQTEKLYEPDFSQNLQQMEVMNEFYGSYDPILTHISSSSHDYNYFGEEEDHQLEQLPYSSASEELLFPRLWSW